MHPLAQVTSFALLAACWGCAPSTSLPPPSGWRLVENRKFDLWVPPDIKAWAPVNTNASYDHFTGNTIELSFHYDVLPEDPTDFTNAPHFASMEERICGRAAKIVSCFDKDAVLGYPEIILAYFPNVEEGQNFRFSLIASCRSTNDFETAKTIFRTVRFK